MVIESLTGVFRFYDGCSDFIKSLYVLIDEENKKARGIGCHGLVFHQYLITFIVRLSDENVEKRRQTEL